MRIAISQPEHFPYLGFFQKMCACDLFVILDSVQFSGPRSFQNRNRYLDKTGNYTWFTVPVKKGSYFQMINEVRVSADPHWREKLSKKLFQDIKFSTMLFNSIYSFDKLVDINVASIMYCKELFGIKTPIVFSSSLDVTGQKTQLIYAICRALNATTYVSGLGAQGYMKGADFHDINIEFFYPQIESFESSIVFVNNPNTKIIEKFTEIQEAPMSFCKGV